MSRSEIVEAAENLINQTSMTRWREITSENDVRDAARHVAYIDAGLQAKVSQFQLTLGGSSVIPLIQKGYIYFRKIPDISRLHAQELIEVATGAHMDFSEAPVRDDIPTHVLSSHIRGHIFVTLYKTEPELARIGQLHKI